MRTYYIADIFSVTAAPDRILLFRAGQIELEKEGKFTVDKAAFDAVAEQWKRRGNDIVIDYEHQSLDTAKAPAAGWIKNLTWEPDGIYASVTWTQDAASHIANGEYRYFSPVFYTDKSGRVAGLHSVALTNTPKTNHLKPILAKLSESDGEPMEKKVLERLIKTLGLPENATEDDALKAVEALKTAPKPDDTKPDTDPEPAPEVAKAILDALDLKEGNITAVVAAVNALKQTPKAMVRREEFNAVVAKLADRDAEEAVKSAMQAGKITPEQKAWAKAYAVKDLEGFRLFVSKAPAVIPVSPLPTQEPKPEETDITKNGAVLEVAKMMGVSLEDLKKYAKN